MRAGWPASWGSSRRDWLTQEMEESHGHVGLPRAGPCFDATLARAERGASPRGYQFQL